MKPTSRKIAVCLSLLMIVHVYLLIRTVILDSVRTQAASFSTPMPLLTGDEPSRKLDNQSSQKRSFVAKDEFFHKPATSSLVEEYFKAQLPDWQADKERLRLKPTWSCSNDPLTTKIILLHMTRSAGSTLRPFFLAYGSQCQRGVALVGMCVDVGIETMEGDDVWMNVKDSPQAGNECWLNYVGDRTGARLNTTATAISTAYLRKNNIDVLGGHLSLGAGSSWANETRKQPLHVIFFRDPLTKFMSQMAVAKSLGKLSMEHTLELIRNRAKEGLEKGHYRDSVTGYLITPQQRAWVESQNVQWTQERRQRLALANLFRFATLVGLVERMPESWKMLQFVLDKNNEMSSIFEFFSSPERLSATMEAAGYNRTGDVTEAIVNAVKADQPTMDLLNEYLSFEMRIYEYAKQLHEHQYAWLQEDIDEEEKI